MVIRYAMAKNQILCSGRSADRIGLHETEPIDRPLQSGWREQRHRNGMTPKVPDCYCGLIHAFGFTSLRYRLTSMRRFLVGVSVLSSLALGTVAQSASNPFLGRWDF